MNPRLLLYSILIAATLVILPSPTAELPERVSGNDSVLPISSFGEVLAAISPEIEERAEELRRQGLVGDQCGGGDFQAHPAFIGPVCENVTGCDESTDSWQGIPGCVSGHFQDFCDQCPETVCSTDEEGNRVCTTISVTKCTNNIPICEEWSCQQTCTGRFQEVHTGVCGSFAWDVHDTYPPDTAYIWDSQTGTCGCGFPEGGGCFAAPVPETPVPGPIVCEGEVGAIDVDRFNELKPIAEEMAQKVLDLFGFSVRPEFMLAVMHTESNWKPLLIPPLRHYCTKAPFASEPGQCPTLFSKICGNPNTVVEIMGMYGISCDDMPLSSAAAMGIAQFLPTTWTDIEAQIKMLTGRTFTNPWSDTDAVAANAYYLGLLLSICGGDEASAAGKYFSVGCDPNSEYWARVKQVLPIIESLFAGTCGFQIDACPLVMTVPPTQPSDGCVTLNSDFCPNKGCLCYFEGLKAHRGVDLDAESGEPVYAVENGIIALANGGCPNFPVPLCNGGAGNYVILQGDSGLRYRYLHLLNNLPVSTFESVIAGQIIGFADNSGSIASGLAHLHFEVIVGGSVDDPRKYFSCIPQTCGATVCPAG